MATIRREISLSASADKVWQVLEDIGAVHTRLAPGFVVATQLEPGPTRTVTFANGFVARERIVGIEQKTRRLAYSVVGGVEHHNASFQVLADGAGSKLLWITDVLPDAAAAQFETMIDQGARVIQTTLNKLGAGS